MTPVEPGAFFLFLGHTRDQHAAGKQEYEHRLHRHRGPILALLLNALPASHFWKTVGSWALPVAVFPYSEKGTLAARPRLRQPHPSTLLACARHTMALARCNHA